MRWISGSSTKARCWIRKQLDDLKEIFPTLVLFGDPAQLAPVGQSGEMVFDKLPDARKLVLHRIHRQETDNPILDLAHALGDDSLTFEAFEKMVEDAAASDPRVIRAERVEADKMARSPVLVWRNATRIRLIHAFRAAYDAPEDALLPGEPLICDGIELPVKHRKRRIDLEARGLIKGAQVIYLGPGKKPGFSRLHVIGAEDPRISAASIIKIELPGTEEPFIPYAARMGATFLHGAAVTIHKAQGSQWEDVQVFRARPLCGLSVRADGCGPAAVETAGLCRDHAGRKAAVLGGAQSAGAADRGAGHRRSAAVGPAAGAGARGRLNPLASAAPCP